MKYTFLVFTILVQVFFLSSERVSASAVAGSLEITQNLNRVLLVASKSSEAVTAVSTKLAAIDQVIGRPIVTGLINIAQQEAANNIIAWANGGFEGNSLIVADPEKYIRDQGLLAVKDALGSIPEDSIYGNSIFSSVLKQYRGADDLKSQIESLSKSNLPLMVQESLCTDLSLTSYAEKALSGTEYSSADVVAKKREIYNYACNGNPSNDPVLAAKLMDLNTQNSAITGLDGFLAVTSGDNEYTKSQLVKNAIAAKEAEKKALADKEIFQGAGPISQKKCLEYGPTYAIGEVPKCIKEVILTPGEQVGEALSRAANSGIDRLTNLTGEGLGSLLTNLAMAKLTKGLNTAIQSAVNDASSPSGTPSNVSITTSSVAPARQDLVGDAQSKASILNPMLKQLEFYTQTLNNLESTDTSYIADLSEYQSKITTGKTCYDTLVADNGSFSANTQVIAAYAFYADRQKRIDAIRRVIVPELRTISEARSLVTETTASLKKSNSTQEISSIFNKYSSLVDERGYPTYQTESERYGEYTTNKNDSQNDTDVKKYFDTCNQLTYSRGING